MSGDLYRELRALGLDADQIGGVLDIIDKREAGYKAADEARKTQVRERVAKWRDKRRNVTETIQERNSNATETLVRGSARVEDITSNLEDTGSQFSEAKASSNKPRKARSSFNRFAEEFENSFWPAWPEKAGKKEAAASFERQRRAGVALEDILAGVERYKLHKPRERQWMGAAKFLNQERWLDEAPSGPRLVHTNSTAPPDDETTEEWLARRKSERDERERREASGR